VSSVSASLASGPRPVDYVTSPSTSSSLSSGLDSSFDLDQAFEGVSWGILPDLSDFVVESAVSPGHQDAGGMDFGSLPPVVTSSSSTVFSAAHYCDFGSQTDIIFPQRFSIRQASQVVATILSSSPRLDTAAVTTQAAFALGVPSEGSHHRDYLFSVVLADAYMERYISDAILARGRTALALDPSGMSSYVGIVADLSLRRGRIFVEPPDHAPRPAPAICVQDTSSDPIEISD
jgi:hypothetical protein